ncbi:hypothetical protein E2C01_095852 [Portunus trituberculatus]|uniref:Uncharacterized protein n=1 Tax=Portunus trituberculatus TaxID=210409 RepID=A0A5B7K6S0_PORTR|nr:hypothetical protein [Portunus trituberculatus]
MCTAHPVVYTQAQTPPRVTTAIHGVQILVTDKSDGQDLRTTGLQYEASQLSITCVATTTTIQCTTDTTQQMMGAHSRPPKHTGDYSYQQQKRDETITRPSASPHPSGRTTDRKCRPNRAHSLEQQARSPTATV